MSSGITRAPHLTRRRPRPVRAGLARLTGDARALVAGGRWAEAALVAVVLACLMAVRGSLAPWVTDDYTQFLQVWYRYLEVHGFRAFGDPFANYNMPYLYLLYAGTLLHVDGLAWVKLIGAVSDLALAAGCAALLRQLRAPMTVALAGSGAVLLLPEVLLNSAGWGQADSTYTAFIVWALWAAVRRREITTWALFGLAFAFKLQAAFILPAFVVVHLTRRWSWRGPVAAIAVLLAAELPALAAGRSPGSLASIYLDQASGYADLSMHAPTLYALLSESQHDVLRSAGMFFAMGCVALLSVLVLSAARRRPLDARSIVLFVAALAALAPYTLPLMHERYFYVANVLLFVLALIDRRLMPWALAAQAVAVLAYTPFLFKTDPVVPMGVLALIEGALVVVVVRALVRRAGAMPVIPDGMGAPLTEPVDGR